MATPDDIQSLLNDLHGSLQRYLAATQGGGSDTGPVPGSQQQRYFKDLQLFPKVPMVSNQLPFAQAAAGAGGFDPAAVPSATPPMAMAPHTPSSTFVDPMRDSSDVLGARRAVQERDPAAFGGSDLQGSERFSELGRRGTADLSFENLSRFAKNASGLIGLATGNPMSMIQAGMKLARGQPLVQDFEGYAGLPPGVAAGIKTRAQLNAAQAKAQRAHNASVNATRSGRDFGGGTGNTSVAGGRSVGGLAVGNDGRVAGGI